MNTTLYRISHIGIFSLIVTLLYVCFATPLFAEGYTPLVSIPGISGTPSLPDYINKVYLLTIAVGVFIAILRIAYAGVKYSMSGVVTDKASAKNDIKGVLIGLAILLLPALVLNTINPDLLRLDFLDGLSKLDINSNSISNPGGASTNTAGTQVVLIPNCVTGGGDLDTGCAKTECDKSGGKLTTSTDPEFSKCTISKVYIDP